MKAVDLSPLKVNDAEFEELAKSISEKDIKYI